VCFVWWIFKIPALWAENMIFSSISLFLSERDKQTREGL
jgi:hypothetical protein